MYLRYFLFVYAYHADAFIEAIYHDVISYFAKPLYTYEVIPCNGLEGRDSE